MSKDKKLVNITRSFAMKKSLGNYEMADFFTSQTVECYEDEVDEKSEQVYQWCKEQTLKAFNNYGKIDWSNAPENMTLEQIEKRQKNREKQAELTEQERADKSEAKAHRAMDDRQEAKYQYAGKDEDGNTQFDRVD